MPLFPFGAGLSYTTFELACDAHAVVGKGNVSFGCTVRNTGGVRGDEVVQVYHAVCEAIRRNVSHPVPIKQLIEFERVSLAAGKGQIVKFSVPVTRLAVTTNSGAKKVAQIQNGGTDILDICFNLQY